MAVTVVCQVPLWVSVPVMAPVLVFRLRPEGRPVAEYVTVVPLMLSVAAAERLTVSPTLLVGPVGGLVNAIAEFMFQLKVVSLL